MTAWSVLEEHISDLPLITIPAFTTPPAWVLRDAVEDQGNGEMAGHWRHRIDTAAGPIEVLQLVHVLEDDYSTWQVSRAWVDLGDWDASGWLDAEMAEALGYALRQAAELVRVADAQTLALGVSA